MCCYWELEKIKQRDHHNHLSDPKEKAELLKAEQWILNWGGSWWWWWWWEKECHVTSLNLSIDSILCSCSFLALAENKIYEIKVIEGYIGAGYMQGSQIYFVFFNLWLSLKCLTAPAWFIPVQAQLHNMQTQLTNMQTQFINVQADHCRCEYPARPCRWFKELSGQPYKQREIIL